MVERYTNISLPDELIEEIDRVVKLHSLGYKNRADLCKEAIRIFLRNLVHYEETKKFEIKKKK
jgi:metal-responsive CopG/Arc/MetJ family transcriptional regulator